MIQNKNIKTIDSYILTEYIVYILWKASHLKIQKLIYYIQWFHLAYFNLPIINDDFQAWLHWPVSRTLFDKLKWKSLLYNELSYIKKDNEKEITEKISILSPEQLQLINEVLNVYWKYTWIDLEKLTHKEEPWLNARKWYWCWEKCEEIISHKEMKIFFKDLINI